MKLFQREAFETFILRLPAVELVHQWGDASVGKIGGKIFAIFSPQRWAGEAAISFKCSDMSYQLLIDLEGISPAPYLARAKWVQIKSLCALTEAEIEGYISQAHRLVGAKLTRKVRQELGLGVQR